MINKPVFDNILVESDEKERPSDIPYEFDMSESEHKQRVPLTDQSLSFISNMKMADNNTSPINPL